jgi:hypothetical protein
MSFPDSQIVVGHMLENFVDQCEVEVIVGEFDGLDVSNRYPPVGQPSQTLGFVDLLGAVFDSPGICPEVRQRPDVFARVTPAIDCALAAQWPRDGADPVEALLQVEGCCRVTASSFDFELRHLSRVIKLDVSLRLPPISCTSA